MSNRKPNIERLKELRRTMEWVREHQDGVVHFDMSNWGSIEAREMNADTVMSKAFTDKKKELPNVKAQDLSQQPKLDCGHAGCCLGWAALNKNFRKSGLTMKVTNPFWQSNVRHEPVVNCTVVYRDHEEQEAGEVFFGLTEEEAEFLFIPSCINDELDLDWVTVDDVIQCIDFLLEKFSNDQHPTSGEMFEFIEKRIIKE